MSKIKKLKKKFTAFASQLSPDECREQLALAYLQMEKCMQVLRGADVEPVSMMDNGESSDLELFYRCKKAAEELAYLNKMVHDGKKVGTICFVAELPMMNLRFDTGNPNSVKWPFVETILAEYENEYAKKSSNGRFAKGQEVWYMFGDRVQHSTIEYPMRDVDGITIYKTKLGHNTAECETFESLEELMENLKKTVNE